jgi:predicted deacylase
MKTVERLALLPSSPGTARHIAIHRYAGTRSGLKVYMQASLHANELPAMLVGQHLIALLDDADGEGRINGEIVIVPVANPIGLGQGVDGVHLGRYELATGQNFNRGFFDHAAALAERVGDRLGADADVNIALIRREWAALVAAQQPSSELASLRRHLMSHALQADIVLDLHSADDALMHLYFGAARWPDGADLSAELGSAATLLAADSGGEPFDEVFSNIWAKLRGLLGTGKPIPDATMSATIELRGHADVSDELAAGDAQALLRFLMRRGVVAGDPGPLRTPRCEATPLDAVDILTTPVGGCLVYKVPLGARLRRGDVVAEIVDPLAEDPGRRRTPICTTTDGILYQRKLLRQIRPGQSCGKVAGTQPLPTRQGVLLEP